MDTLNLQDVPAIPDLSGVQGQETEAWGDGWYEGTIVEQRTFTDKNGNERVFDTSDTASQDGSSRNIRLQTVIKRRSDGRTLGTNVNVNYRPEDLTPETVQAVTARLAAAPDQMGDLFRPFMALQGLGRLQKIAGVRQFQRNGNGGLDLSPVYAKSGYFRLGEDRRNPQYKEVKEFRAEAPKRARVN